MCDITARPFRSFPVSKKLVWCPKLPTVKIEVSTNLRSGSIDSRCILQRIWQPNPQGTSWINQRAGGFA